MRLLLLSLCSIFAVMPPGLCACAIVEKKAEAVERTEPVIPHRCCSHTHHDSTAGVPAVNKTATHDQSEPLNDPPHHYQMCERMPATVPPAPERVTCPEVSAGLFAVPTCELAEPVHAQFLTLDPIGLSPRLRLYHLCALRLAADTGVSLLVVANALRLLSR